MTAPDPEPAAEGEAQTERTLARTLVLFRAGGLVQIVVAGSLDISRYRSVPLILALVGIVAAEGAALSAAVLRLRRIQPAWVSADVVFCAVALAAGAYLTAAPYGHSWAYFMYPFSVIISFGVGVAYRGWPAPLALASLLAAAYAGSAVGIHHDPVWNVIPNALTYYPNTLVAWAIARRLRRTGRQLDEHRELAVSAATDLAQERERLRHARILHDRVLQTMEALAAGPWIRDGPLREHVATEAAWLRGLVQGNDGSDADLLTGMHLLVQRARQQGLRVQLNDSGYRLAAPTRRQLPQHTADATVSAVREALSNIVKHAGVDTATLRLTVVEQEIVVTLLDHGNGFDHTTRHHGLGIDQSMTARIHEIGGVVNFDTAPGAGTRVEIRIPLQI